MQNKNSKVQSKEENRQERQEKHRLDRKAEMELEMKRLDRLAQADADRLDCGMKCPLQKKKFSKCLLNLTFIKELQFTQNHIRYVCK